MCDAPQHRGRSLVDVVVVFVILVAIVSLILLRVSGNRESARRIACEENLRSVFLAAESYSLRFGHFPIGTQNPDGPIRSEPSGYHHNWIEGLLPMMDQQALYDGIDFQYGVYAAPNQPIGLTSIPTVRCPASESTVAINATTYAGVASSTEAPIDQEANGMFILNRPLSIADAVDGQSFVFLAGEKALDFVGSGKSAGEPADQPPHQWNSGTRASLRNTGHRINAPPPKATDAFYVGGFSSNHPDGCYFLLVDGAFRFYTEQTDPELLKQMADRADSAAENRGN